MSLRVFIGFDERQPVAAAVLAHSIERRSSEPVSISRLQIRHMPVKRRGLTSFTFSRFLVPYLCGYQGVAVFIDADMLCLGDFAELEKYAEHPVSVVKNELRFEWPSLMVFNCGRCIKLTPELVEKGDPFSFSWADSVGVLPSEFNHLVGYDKPRPDAKVVHYTQGIPCFPETKDCEYAKEWMDELKHMNSTVSWEKIMGNSVHKEPVLRRLGRSC